MQGLKQVFTSAVTDVHTVDKEGVGTHRWVRDANGWKCYLYVKNSDTVSTVVGNVYAHGMSGFTITTGSNPSTFLEEIFKAGQAGKSALIAQMAGVAVSVIPTLNFGWIQCYGYCPTIIDEGTVAVVIGDTLKMVTAQYYVVHDTAPGTGPTVGNRHILAYTADAGGAGQHTIAGFIQCLG